MVKILAFLLGLIFSQWIGDAVKASSARSSFSGWIASFVTQYICCVILIAWFDQAHVAECLRSGVILTFAVRWFYFMKRLK